MNNYFVTGVIDRFEGKMAVLKLDDGQSLDWPIKNLPDEVKEGQAVRLVLSTSQTEEDEREKTAKAILNEILNNQNSN